MSEQQFETIMEEMADFTAESLSKEEESSKKIQLRETLVRFKNLLKSREFSRKCKRQAKEHNVSECTIKNIYARKILNSIGATTGIVIETLGEAFTYLVRLISYVIQSIVDIAISAITKLIDIVTFRKPVEA